MHYHIVGVAGAGMSALAHMMLDQGHTVSGSDEQSNRLTAALVERGAVVHVGHDPSYGAGADAVIATSAVSSEHPEIAAAQAAGIAVLRRIDVWRRWSEERSIIAVAGTHGKTTTTAMLAYVLTEMGINAGFLIGAEYPQLGVSARWGDSSAPMVIEADEYDHAFLGLFPDMAIVTNIEWDHPDIYPSPREYTAAFVQFIHQVRTGIVVSEQAAPSIGEFAGAVLTYGMGAGQQHDLIAIESHGQGLEGNKAPPIWSVVPGGGSWPQPARAATFRTPPPGLNQDSLSFSLLVPGIHNVCNTLAVLGVVALLGLDMAQAARTLARFRGVARRFEVKGVAAGVTVVDDYAHHPSEVAATLAAARSYYESRRIVAYIQPHTFSRTQALLELWSMACVEADVVFVGAVYASREAGVGSPHELAQQLVEHIAHGSQMVWYAGEVGEAAQVLLSFLQSGDILITMGAGDGFLVGEQVLEVLQTRMSARPDAQDT